MWLSKDGRPTKRRNSSFVDKPWPVLSAQNLGARSSIRKAAVTLVVAMLRPDIIRRATCSLALKC